MIQTSREQSELIFLQKNFPMSARNTMDFFQIKKHSQKEDHMKFKDSRFFGRSLRTASLIQVLLAFVLAFGAQVYTFGNSEAVNRKIETKHTKGTQQTFVPLNASLLENLQWRCIGPAVPSGRTTDLAVCETDTRIIYAATATGGLWKTANNGTTWEPVFDSEGSISLGAVAMASSNPNVVWVGTGEAWNARISSYGDGVYKSEDGGKTWKNMGLIESRYIGRIVIHPEDSDIVYVAALGSLWGPNEERGLFKTMDGGETWSKILYINEHTGVVDVSMDPRNANVIYASTYLRERRAWNFIGGGPENGLYKSTDAGKNWTRLTVGLPKGDTGRIGISISRSNPAIIYAAVEAKPGENGVYRSDDFGASWECRTTRWTTRLDYGQIRCDPNDPERVYLLHVRLYRSEDGGKTFRSDVFGREAHGDWRCLWINPANPHHIVTGNDGGVYFSYDKGKTWDFMTNIPAAQFYDVAFDMQEPFYYVYGGLQDNGTFGGPSRTRYADGITNADWFLTTGGDGFYAQIDPTDPTVVYSESQYGVLNRFNTKTGERRMIQPQPPTGESYRWNWSSPIVLSKHDQNTLYFAANKIFRSINRGDSWKVISPDLTRQLDTTKLPVMGKIWPLDSVAYHAGTSDYGSISTISESPLEKGLLACGTDDGLIHVTQDDGDTWRTVENIPGVPEHTWVTRVLLSPHDRNTIYVTFTGHRNDDFAPYVYTSRDLGRTWKSIKGNLPEFGSVKVITEHPNNPNLLFVGTEFGVFLSISGGGHWVALKNNLPTVNVYDIEIHPRENDLIIATHGRGIWILDDIAALEELTPAVLDSACQLFSIRPATQIHPYVRGLGSYGKGHFSAPNPPNGANLTYYINPNEMQTPVLEILNEKDEFIRRIDIVPNKNPTGLQRQVWDLRSVLPFEVDRKRQPSYYRRVFRGPFVLPGLYTIRLSLGELQVSQKMEVKGDPFIRINPGDRQIWQKTLRNLLQMEGASRAVIHSAEQVKTQLDKVRKTLKNYPGVPASIHQQIRESTVEMNAIFEGIQGSRERIAAQQPKMPPINRLIGQLYFSIEGSTGLPTDDQMRLSGYCYEQLNGLIIMLDHLVNELLPSLNTELTRLGIPWTPGRPIQLPKLSQ